MADNSESDADEEDTPIDLQSLPAEVLLIIAQLLLPPNLLADAPHLWQPLMRFGACATGFNEALADACVAAFPANIIMWFTRARPVPPPPAHSSSETVAELAPFEVLRLHAQEQHVRRDQGALCVASDGISIKSRGVERAA